MVFLSFVSLMKNTNQALASEVLCCWLNLSVRGGERDRVSSSIKKKGQIRRVLQTEVDNGPSSARVFGPAAHRTSPGPVSGSSPPIMSNYLKTETLLHEAAVLWFYCLVFAGESKPTETRAKRPTGLFIRYTCSTTH